MLLVNLTQAFVRWANTDDSLLLKSLTHVGTEERVTAKFGGDDHAGSLQRIFGCCDIR